MIFRNALLLIALTNFVAALPQHKNICLTTDNDKCALPFVYKGVKYSGCINVDLEAEDLVKGFLWCSTKTDGKGDHVQGQWGYCSESGCKQDMAGKSQFKDSSSMTTDGPVQGEPCVFPFVYFGVRYNGCTKVDTNVDNERLWCATKTDNKEGYIDGEWGYCGQDAQQDLHGKPLSKECLTMGGQSPEQPCIFPFVYQNVTYNACTTVESKAGRPWCATGIDESTQEMQWGYCNRNCPKERSFHGKKEDSKVEK